MLNLDRLKKELDKFAENVNKGRFCEMCGFWDEPKNHCICHKEYYEALEYDLSIDRKIDEEGII